MSDSRILPIATFGMELVECGGALAKNGRADPEHSFDDLDIYAVYRPKNV